MVGFLSGSAVKEPACNDAAPGDVDSFAGLGRSPGEGNSNGSEELVSGSLKRMA